MLILLEHLDAVQFLMTDGLTFGRPRCAFFGSYMCKNDLPGTGGARFCDEDTQFASQWRILGCMATSRDGKKTCEEASYARYETLAFQSILGACSTFPAFKKAAQIFSVLCSECVQWQFIPTIVYYAWY